MIVNILICYAFQIVFTIGIIVLFGFAIGLCNNKFYANFGNYGMTVCYITGAIGTPVHECSHALFCVIFGHKINEIKLFQVGAEDGTLGYVSHSYNPKNIYQRTGNFFIGIAPIIVIAAILYLFACLLLPNFVVKINSEFAIKSIVSDIDNVFTALIGVLRYFFVCAQSWQWWIFLILGIFLALHMTLSTADIKGALSGLLFLLIAVLAVNVILALINGNWLIIFTRGVLEVASYLLCILMLSLIISLIAVSVSFVFRILKRT